MPRHAPLAIPMNLLSKNPVPPEDRIPIKEKLAFGSGQVAGALQGNLTENLINPVFVLTMGVSPALLGVLAAFYRIWDAITDLFLGWLSDNTRSRWGRRRPYLVIGAILCGLWLPVIWLFNRHWELNYVIAWMIGCQLVLYLFATIWNIPYQSLLLEMTPNTHERTNITVIRQYISTLVWAGMPWCWWLAQRPWFGSGDGQPDVINGAIWIATGAGVVSILFGIIPALFCKERYYKAIAQTEKVPMWRNLKLTFSNHPFLILALLTLLFTVGNWSKGGLAFYTRVYYVCGGDRELAALITGYEGTLSTILGLLGIPLFQWYSNRYGKRAAITAIMAIVFFASISTLLTYNPHYPYLSMLSGLLLAPTNSAIWVLIPSMTGDIVDYDELRTSERREGAFAAVFSWIFKLAISVSAALSGILVEGAGFNAKLPEQPEDVLWRMRLLLVIVPAVFIGGAIWLCTRYSLTTERMAETRAALEARRGRL